MKTTAAAKKTRTHSPCVLNRNTDSQHDRPDARRGRARRAGARLSVVCDRCAVGVQLFGVGVCATTALSTRGGPLHAPKLSRSAFTESSHVFTAMFFVFFVEGTSEQR